MMYRIMGPGWEELASFKYVKNANCLYEILRLYAQNSATHEVVLYVDDLPFLSCIYRRCSVFHDVRAGKNSPI